MSINTSTPIAVITLLMSASMADAQRGCAADRPCITQAYQKGSRILLGWDAHQDYDFYQIRWSRPGRAETQVKVIRAWWELTNACPRTAYEFKVQACKKAPFAPSRCTPWATERLVTK